MAARVAGVPRPFSLIASRNSSSSTSLPAPSIALSKVASVNRGGGLVWLCLTSISLVFTNSPERTALYRKMAELVQVYAPWHPGHYTYRNALTQPWVRTFKPHAFIDHPWEYIDVAR